MICLRCGHYIVPDREMAREQRSNDCTCDCHPWNKKGTCQRCGPYTGNPVVCELNGVGVCVQCRDREVGREP